jgi:hypothetical protein
MSTTAETQVAEEITRKIGKDYWGPRVWKLLHSFSAKISLTQDTRILWKLFLKATLAVLPCPICKEHFSVSLRPLLLSITTISENELESWIFERLNSSRRTNFRGF